MTKPLGDESTCWRGWHLWNHPFVLLCLVAILFAFWARWWVSRPFITLRKFAEFVEVERFDDAMALIVPDDRKKLSAAYWEQFRLKELEVLSSPTPLTFIDGRMAAKIGICSPDAEYTTDSGVHFVIDGNKIFIHEVTFREPP